jgi:hypothetical protein
MSTAELKKNVISKISDLNDNQLLEDILRMIDLQSGFPVFELSTEQRVEILQGREQIQNGKFLTNEQVEKDLKEWLNK